MDIKVGDLVTRDSYNNDLVFKVISIENNLFVLKGISVRLIADGFIDDLRLYNGPLEEKDNDAEIAKRLNHIERLDRNEYFYIPGKVLHIDADHEYLTRSMEFYKETNIMAFPILNLWFVL